jgi:hypothetical protein
MKMPTLKNESDCQKRKEKVEEKKMLSMLPKLNLFFFKSDVDKSEEVSCSSNNDSADKRKEACYSNDDDVDKP